MNENTNKELLKLPICPKCGNTKVMTYLTNRPIYGCYKCNIEWNEYGIRELMIRK
jgi:ribosomal protein S27AE